MPYADARARWRHDPEGFWRKAAQGIDWERPWDQLLSEQDGAGRWWPVIADS